MACFCGGDFTSDLPVHDLVTSDLPVQFVFTTGLPVHVLVTSHLYVQVPFTNGFPVEFPFASD